MNSIKKYAYKPNTKYLYPLCEYVELLKEYCNCQSDVPEFNYYIQNTLLTGIDGYIKICKDYNDNQTKEMIDKDIKDVVDGTAHWNFLFRKACKIYSVTAIEKETL